MKPPLDRDTDETVQTIAFGSETGMPQYDAAAKKVYVNLRSTNEIAAVDPATATAVERYAVNERMENPRRES